MSDSAADRYREALEYLSENVWLDTNVGEPGGLTRIRDVALADWIDRVLDGQTGKEAADDDGCRSDGCNRGHRP